LKEGDRELGGFKIRLSEKSSEIIKELAPRLYSEQGAGASIAKKKKKLVRQATFDEKAETSSVPARDSERPQLEKQGDLFQYERDTQNLSALEKSKE